MDKLGMALCPLYVQVGDGPLLVWRHYHYGKWKYKFSQALFRGCPLFRMSTIRGFSVV